MGEQEITIRLEKPDTGRDDLVLVHFDGLGIQEQKFAAGILAGPSAADRAEHISYIIPVEDERDEDTEKEPDTVAFRLKGKADSAVTVWAMNKEKAPLSQDQLEAIEFDAQKAAERGILRAKEDIIAHRQRR